MSAGAPRLPFSKMHGAGNDFVVLDRRAAPGPLPTGLAARLADRHRGVGCDQLLAIEPPRTAGAALGYRIWNADGSEALQCGNGARCVAAWARRAGIVAEPRFVMDSPSGPVEVHCGDDGIEVALSVPGFEPRQAGFAGAIDEGGRAWLAVGDDRIGFGVVSMGNPHAVVEVDDVDRAEVATLGAALQRDPRFAAGCNVGFVQRVDRGALRLRVFERGVGETLACGSGACAAAAWLMRDGRVERRVTVALPGGRLTIHWPHDGAPIRMLGPAEFVFEGVLEP
jgi:diaminopimelate epimerase